MTDERREYQEMVSTMKLSDEKGEMLLGEAKERLVSHKKKVKNNIVTSIVVVLLCAGLGSGVTYAASGKSPFDFFAAMFQSSDDELVRVLGEEFIESGETITIKNWKITLERYWYDQNRGKLMAELTWETVDGGPLVDIEFMSNIKTNGISITTDNFPNPGEYFFMCHDFFDLKIAGEGNRRVEMDSLNRATVYWNTYDKRLRMAEIDGVEKNATIEITAVIRGWVYETEGFNLAHTGEWKTRRLNPDYVEDCKSIEMDGTRMVLELKKARGRDCPYYIEITMKDGTKIFDVTSAYWSCSSFEWTKNKKYGASSDLDSSFIDIDQIESVQINGVEVPFLDE